MPRRQLVQYVNDQPVQIHVSVLPLDLVVDTPVADPARQPWPGGTIAELHALGQVVTRVAEEARSRAPSTAERRLLEMETPGSVWDIRRIFYAGHGPKRRPVECSTVVAPAASIVLAYFTDLD